MSGYSRDWFRGSVVTEPCRTAAGPGSARAWILRLLAVIGVAVTCTVAWAVTPPREGPGDPPPVPGGALDGWQVIGVPGLPAQAILGDVWVDESGAVYVWANYPTRSSAGTGTLEDPVEGERLPGPGRSQPRSSTLYRFDGVNWTRVLDTPGETAVLLYGTSGSNLFASTIAAAGESRLYRFDGTNWDRVAIPGGLLDRTHSMTGAPGAMFLRIGRKVLLDDGAGFAQVFEEPAEHEIARGMVPLGNGDLFMMCSDGHAIRQAGQWADIPAASPFWDLQDAWGVRDPQGRLNVYALGAVGPDQGVQLWRFQEDNALTHQGRWSTVHADPSAGNGGPGGCGFHLWGGAYNDLYATGVVEGEGHVFHFDGTAWTQLALPQPFGAMHGVWGTDRGGVWFSTESGKLVRYQRANRVPDVTHAVPSVERLWPSDMSMVPVDVLGIVDPDGDPLTIQIDEVHQDEDPASPGATQACPDAVLQGSRVLLRAEHAENGDGRTYRIEYTATDRLGGTSHGALDVCVPHYVTTPCDVDVALFDSQGACGVAGTIQTEESERGMRIRYSLAEPTPVKLGAYDLAGRCVAMLEEGPRTMGVHEVMWARTGLERGIYFLRLRTEGGAVTHRVVWLR